MHKLLAVSWLMVMAPVAFGAESTAIVVHTGPVRGAPNSIRSVTLARDLLQTTTIYDVQDGREHNVRGVWLRVLLERLEAPKNVDAVVFSFEDGMQIPVKLRDKNEVESLFIAIEHGDVLERFGNVYPVHKKLELQCPKVVFTRKMDSYSIWHYPGQLVALKLVSWKAHEAQLAQPTRRVPDRKSWSLHMKHCMACHGIGGQGATRGPDFLSNMDAYRRVPALAVTNEGEAPSLHEKVKGYVDGTMPVLDHIERSEIAQLWTWLHKIHASGTK